MMTYSDADKQLTGRCRNSRKLGNNTYLVRHADNTFAIRLHFTDIITLHPDGRIVLNRGVWQTVTTKNRLNEYGPVSIGQTRGVWYVYPRYQKSSDAHITPLGTFANGMTVHSDGTCTGLDTVVQP